MTVSILQGDCLVVLDSLPEASVDLVVTSPPYLGLRDYGVEGQIGLEDSPEAFVAVMVELFRKVWRVLKPSGVVYLNLGDSYAGSWGSQGHRETPKTLARNSIANHPKRAARTGSTAASGLKPKDMMMIPARVAIALQADGWWLRQDIIWSKPNPMPESVRDRCTKAHEYIFLLAKSGKPTCWRHEDGRWVWQRPAPDYVWRNAATRKESAEEVDGDGWRRVNRWEAYDYYYDAAAITETSAPSTITRLAQDVDSQEGSARSPLREGRPMKAVSRKNSFARTTKDSAGVHGQTPQFRPDREVVPYEGRRNKRSVWSVGTEPFSEAHFATFPPKLIEPCILAGCPKGGVVLDPFGGAGTTGLVAERLGRDSILIELNPAYIEIARSRLRAGLAVVEAETPETTDAGPLFGGAAA